MIIKGMGASHATIPAMNEQEVINFLQSKLNLQLATIDENGDPNIQPVLFDYEKDSEKLHIMTSKMSNKVRNIRRKPNVYFSTDDENFPYEGVKGKATARIIEDHQSGINGRKDQYKVPWYTRKSTSKNANGVCAKWNRDPA
jgi:nitroimidazol reductase NimA-like FMN-containing flavoprotein (pyridoxamine 5'-phosphate oxidase superfamily)